MIGVDELLYSIDQRLNKLSTNSHQQIPLEDKILALNEAQIKIIKTKVDPNNIYKIGLEGFKKRYQDLQFLVENPEDHKLTPVLSDSYFNKYIAKTKDLDPKYMFYLDSYAIANKGQCLDRIIYTNADLVKHADLTLLLTNSNYKPSFEYQETIVDISSDEIHVYSDGTFEIDALYISYIRYPLKIDKAGYVNFDGTDSENQDCELEDYLKDEILDLTTENLAMYTENISAVQAAQARMSTDE